MADSRKYCFHISPHNEEAVEPEVVHCSPKRIEEIKQLSVILKDRISNHGSGEGIPLELDDAADIDTEVIKYIVTDLPLKSGTDPGPIRLADLSKPCNAWWKYKWRPESANVLWEHLTRSGLETQSPQGVVRRRCWRHQIPNKAYESSLYMVNIVIVLGLDDNLREEMDRELRLQIRNIVWNSNLPAQLKTSVDFLHNIEEMRLKELKAMFKYFYQQLLHLSKTHPKNVRHVQDKLKAEMDVDFFENWQHNFHNGARITTYSVYEFVDKIECILTGPHERPIHEPDHHRHKVVNGPDKPREGPNVDWSAAMSAGARRTATAAKNVFSLLKGSHDSKWSDDLEELFDGADSHLQKSQEALVNRLIELRNDELDSWKKVLRDGNEIVE